MPSERTCEKSKKSHRQREKEERKEREMASVSAKLDIRSKFQSAQKEREKVAGSCLVFD